MSYLAEITEKIDKFSDYEQYLKECEKKKAKLEKTLDKLCGKLTNIRKKAAHSLEQAITSALAELNFDKARFRVSMEPLGKYSPKGADAVEFLVATNPGADLYPLGKVASGGELSRIMLAIKTVFADTDHIETLIFDEIDAGISGKTAWKVSEKLGMLGKKRQVICITHLPQIAAQADTHFYIEKNVEDGITKTSIVPLTEERRISEIARMLGGEEISEAALQNAEELIKMAGKAIL